MSDSVLRATLSCDGHIQMKLARCRWGWVFCLRAAVFLVAASASAPAAKGGHEGVTEPGAPADTTSRLIGRVRGSAGNVISISRDGKRLITAGGDAARVWDAEALKPLTEPLRHGKGVIIQGAAISVDGKKVMTAGGREARLWDVEGAKPPHVIRLPGQVRAAAFSPGGTTVVLACDDRTARVFDVDSGRQTLLLEHTRPVRFAQFSPDGSSVVTVDEPPNGSARLWDVKTGTQLIRPLREVDCASSTHLAAFSPDGKRLAAIFADFTYVWDTETGKKVAETESRAAPFDRGPQMLAVAFSPNGKFLVTAAATHARVWDAATGKARSPELQGVWMAFAAFSADGRFVLTAGQFDEAAVWEVATGKRVFTYQGRDLDTIPAVCFYPDASRVAISSSGEGDTEAETTVWDIPRLKENPK